MRKLNMTQRIETYRDAQCIVIEDVENDVALRVFIGHRYGLHAEQYMITYDGRSYGFKIANYIEDTVYPAKRDEETGELVPVWHIGVLCSGVSMARKRSDPRERNVLLPQKFSSREEQGEVISRIVEILSACGGGVIQLPEPGKAFVEFSDDVKQKLEAGGYIR